MKLILPTHGGKRGAESPEQRVLIHSLLNPWLRLKDYPVLCRSRSFHIMGFGVFAALSAIAFCMVFQGVLLYRGLPAGQVATLAMLLPTLALMVWFFARLVNLIFVGREVFRDPWKHLTATGFNVHGGILGLILWGVLCGRQLDIAPLLILDGLCLAGLLSQAVARIGCYNYGCCYGTPTAGPLAVRYTNPESKILRVNPGLRGVSVHPVQLYTSASNLAAFAAFVPLMRYAPPSGLLSALSLLYFGVNRLVIERFRADLCVNYDSANRPIRLTGRLSWLMLAAGVALLAFVLPGLWMRSPAEAPAVADFLGRVRAYHAAHGPAVGVAVTTSAALIFLGYGVHGERIGVFPLIGRAAPGAPADTFAPGRRSSPYEITTNLSVADWLWVFGTSLWSRQDCYFAIRQKVFLARRDGIRVGMLRLKFYRTFTEIGNAYLRPGERGTRLIWALGEAARAHLGVAATVYAIAGNDLARALGRYGYHPAAEPVPRPLERRFAMSRFFGALLGVDYRLIQLDVHARYSALKDEAATQTVHSAG